jgi:DNA mismatch endonuclease (patch repair protein)
VIRRPHAPDKRRPPASASEVSYRMRRVRRTATLPEQVLASELRRCGLRFQVDRPPVQGIRSRADIVFKSAKVAVFIDGCFWHGCPEHATWPVANAVWWRTKIETNRSRDARITAVLEDAGWSVVRIWEHAVDQAAASVAAEVRGRQRRGSR